MSTDITTTQIPALSPERTIALLSGMYSTIINKGMAVKTLPSVMIWGPPGIGKSQAVKQTAREIENATGKKTVVTDVRLLLFNPIDLRGIPTANEDKSLAVWLKPKIFDMDESEDVINILFLDEISAAPQSVQAAAYQITLDRVIGEHRLPENCIVIAAGNRVTDRSVAFKMPKALANRLMHIEMIQSAQAWKKWSAQSGIDPRVRGFISFRPEALFGFENSGDELAFATPRTWEMVSNILTATGAEINDAKPLIAGLVGMGTAIEFCTYCEIYGELPSVKDIFDGKDVPVPKNTSALYALVSLIAFHAKKHINDAEKLTYSIEYANKMPAEFSVLLLKEYIYMEKDAKKRLMRLPAFQKWLNEKGSLLNGIEE